jgi:hypothetical protein
MSYLDSLIGGMTAPPKRDPVAQRQMRGKMDLASLFFALSLAELAQSTVF